jgi:hypothetical protein
VANALGDIYAICAGFPPRVDLCTVYVHKSPSDSANRSGHPLKAAVNGAGTQPSSDNNRTIPATGIPTQSGRLLSS